MPNVSDIFITGLGLLTPLGHSAWATWRALLAGRTLTDRCDQLPADIAPVDLVRAVGCVSVTPHSASDPAIELAERAARQAINEAGISSLELPTVIASSKGAVHDMAAIPRGPLILVGDALQDRLRLGPMRHVVAACASSLIGVHVARQWMIAEQLDRAIVITSEAALLPMFIHSYARLGVLAKLTPTDYACRPMDNTRNGFVLTEVGAAIVLERLPNRPLAQLTHTAVACETNDLIRTPDHRDALRYVADRLLHAPVDLLHPHATGTLDNDAGELACYDDHAIGDVYACKGALGHGLGSSGLTALVLAVLAGRTQQRPPMPWLTQPLAAALTLNVTGPHRPINSQAIFAAGFGGHVAGVGITTR